MTISREKLGIALAPLILCIADAGVTLALQSGVYWAGSMEYADEGNALFDYFLRHSPFLFVAGIAAWILVFELVVFVVPTSWSRFVALAVTMGHTWGLCTWVYKGGYWFSIAAIVAASGLVALAWRTRPDAPRVRSWPVAIVAMGVILALAGGIWPLQRIYANRSGPLADRLVECASRGSRWEAVMALQCMQGKSWREVNTSLADEGIYALHRLTPPEGGHYFILRARPDAGLPHDWRLIVWVKNGLVDSITVTDAGN
jgi:hypothetical protein